MTEPTETGKKHSRPWGRWLLWILVAVLLLPVMLLLLLQLNGVQNYLRQQGESYLQKKLNTRVQIGYLRARGWQYLELRNVFVADTTNHALFYTGSLKVHYNLFSLLGNELKIDKLEWDTVLVNVYRLNDSTFNYQFAVDAFISPKAIPDTVSKATGTTLQFILKDISLKKFSVRYEDLPGGMNAVLTWNELHLDPDDLLVNDGVYSFRGIRLDGLKGFFRQNYIPKATSAAPPPPPADTSSAALHLLLKKLSITNSSFLYSSDGIGITTAWKIGELKVLNSSLDQDSTRIQIGDLAINNTAGIVAMVPGKDTTPAAPDTRPNTWQLFATRVDLNKLAVRYDNGGPAPKAASTDPDYNHLLLTNLNTHVANIRYRPDSISASMKIFTMRDQSGFSVRKANMDLVFTPQSLLLKNFFVQTNKSILRKNIALTVPSWSTISKNLDQMGIEGDLDSIHVALGEWLGFVPDARKNKYFAPLWNKQLTARAIFKGTLAQLGIKELYINDQQGNVIQANNTVISQAADPEKFNADIPNLCIQSGNKALRSWLPPGTMPDTPRLPENMLITGSFNGGMKNMTTQLQLKSDYAAANVNAKLVNITDSIHGSYDISMPYFRVNPGILMYNTTLGWVSGSLKANGQGYTMKAMAAQAAVQLSEATYNGYTYHGVNVDASINNGAFQAQGQSTDTSINTTFDISGTLGDTSLESLKANMDITKADLYATRWYNEPLTLSGLLNADFSSLEPQHIEGSALLTNWQIATKGHVVPLDTISLLATYSDQQYLVLKSPLGPVNAYGHLDYTKIGAALGQIISKPLLPRDSGRIIQPPPCQLLTWDASLIWPHSLQPLFPALRIDKPLALTGRLNSDSSLFIMQAFMPKLSYDSLKIDSLGLSAHILDTSLQADVALAHMAHPTFPLQHTLVSTRANAGVVNFDLRLDDASYRAKYKLGGILTFLPANVMELSLKPGLLLNKQEWVVDHNNLLRMKNSLPDTANIQLSQGNQSLQLATRPNSSATPALQLNVANFKLSTITGLLATDTLLANGNLNAEATVRNWDKSPLINASLKLDSLTVKNTLMGTVAASVENTQPGQYSLKASLSGNENDVKINGTYDSTINATVNINHLNMSSLEPFTMGNLTQMYGSTDGKFTINGDKKALEILGNLHFNNAGGTISMIGANLHLPDENIIIDEKGIAMNNVVIADSLGNEMVVNGRINTPDFTSYNFNLDVNADNFMVLGTQQKEDQWIYGPAFIDSRVKIRGALDLPRVDAIVKLRDKSKVTMTLPQEAPGLADRQGVVEFVDKSHPVDSALIAKMDSLKYQNPKLKGINFSGNMEITPESLIKIIIDKQNGDYVEAKGTANINATLDASSKMSLTGRYEISEGKYEMSLNQLIKRSFDIQKGSYISFNGDAMNADLDITAKYTVYAPAIDLVGEQLGTDASVRNTYKQRLPFEVYLMIKGNMMKPDISFSLDMPEKERNAFQGGPYNKLKQLNQIPSEVNKQVMGLLVLGTFIPDDPASTLDNSAAGGVAQAARNSVSKILSQQLNNLAGNLIKGVDLNFDLQSQQNYSSGSAQEQTKLNIGASKTLFNDRLTVSVGSNIMLAGSQQPQNASSIVGDVSIDYKLTRDGRYKVRVYRNNNQSVIEGQIVESGVAFMLVMDYDQFREILQHSKRSTNATKLRDTDNRKNKK